MINFVRPSNPSLRLHISTHTPHTSHTHTHTHTHTQLLVNKADLEQLVTETMMLKEFLPKVLAHDYLTSFSKLTQLDQGISI